MRGYYKRRLLVKSATVVLGDVLTFHRLAQMRAAGEVQDRSRCLVSSFSNRENIGGAIVR